MRFVPASKRRAALRIVYDPRPVSGVSGFAHGSASVGYQPRNRIALGRGAHGVGAVGVIAHELGHVLGLVHDDRRCATMNSAAWSRCGLPPSCSILQADDVRGAIARYGGHARPLLPELCPPAPAGLSVDRVAESGRILATITVSPAAGVVGVIERDAVGRCPESSGGILHGQLAAAGATYVSEVTPTGPFVGLSGGTLCVRVWSFDDTGRVSAAALTQQVALPPAAARIGDEGYSLSGSLYRSVPLVAARTAARAIFIASLSTSPATVSRIVQRSKLTPSPHNLSSRREARASRRRSSGTSNRKKKSRTRKS